MREILNQAAAVLIPAFASVVVALISWGLAEAAKYVRSRSKNESVNNAIERICHMTETTVAELSQTVADDLRKASADGRIDATEAAALKARAIELVKARLGAGVMDAAAAGIADLNEFIGARIERSVREQKTQKIDAALQESFGDVEAQ